MSRKGNPWDKAACESFMKTLKYEEVLRNEYRDLADARASICEFLEKIYNEKRLHSALGYMPPARFERNQKDLQGIGKSFHPIKALAFRPTPPLIVWMSFRLAIPWRVALQHGSPPLHQPCTSMP